MKKTLIFQVSLTPTSPFHFDATFHKPSHFPSGDNLWEPGVRWQTWYWQGKKLGLKFINAGSPNKPKVKMTIFFHTRLSRNFVKSLTDEVAYRFNLKLDLTDFYSLFKKDAQLGPVIRRWKGLRPGHQSSLYEYLVIGVLLQNATVRRSIQMLQSLLEQYGKLLEYDGKKLWCFWKPGSLRGVKETELRSLKIGYRAKFLKRIDDQFAQGLIDEIQLRKEDFETQKRKLLELYGVGPATVWYLLFDVFHHYDFFTHISPWEQKIYSKLFFNRDPQHPLSVKKLIQYFNRYGKYKQLAVHYIWEDLWWKRKTKHLPWLEKLIRM